MAEAIIKSFKSQEAWRNWLDKNQDIQEGIWLQVFKMNYFMRLLSIKLSVYTESLILNNRMK